MFDIVPFSIVGTMEKELPNGGQLPTFDWQL